MSKEASPRASDADGSGAGTALLSAYRDPPSHQSSAPSSTSLPPSEAKQAKSKSKAKSSDTESETESTHSDDIEVYPPLSSSLYPGYEAPMGAHGRAPPAHPHGTEVHWATMAQKRALWWRNAVITGMFILTW